MSGYIGGTVPVAMAEPSTDSVETQDLKDNAVTDDKINSVTLDQAVVDISDNETLALAGL
jgi:hypothetical protein